MKYPEPPIDALHGRDRLVLAAAVRNVAPAGLMQSHVGRRLSVFDLRKTDAYCDADGETLERIRAFDVPALLGTTFSVSSAEELSEGVRQLLTSRLPGIAWDHVDVSSGPVHKYQIMHTSVPAPPDEATGQPMALELFGDVKTDQRLGVFIRVATYANIAYPGVGVPLYL